jgi:hypothetical protein
MIATNPAQGGRPAIAETSCSKNSTPGRQPAEPSPAAAARSKTTLGWSSPRQGGPAT